MAENTRNLTEGPILRAIFAVSGPMMMGILGVISVGIADSAFLARLGATELAAIGFVYPVIAAITSLSIGMSAGANAVMSQALGSGDDDAAMKRLALHAVTIGLALGLSVAISFVVISPVLFSALGARGDVLDELLKYTPWWAASFPFLVMMMIANAGLRAHGDGTRTAAIMVGMAAVNVVLDPIFIFGWGPVPELGTAGAGIATCIARTSAGVLGLFWCWRLGIIGLGVNPVKGFKFSTKRIVEVGMPAAVSNAINPAGMAAVTAAVATVGDQAVAGFGAASRIQRLSLVPMLALSAGIGPVIGQNWGARREDRARRAMWMTFAICLGYGGVLAAVLFAFAEPLSLIIASKGAAADYTAQFLRVVGFSLFGYGFVVTANAAMNGRSKALWSMGLSILRTFVVLLPAAWLGVTAFGYTGVLAATVTANVTGAVTAVLATIQTGLLRLGALRSQAA